MSDASRKGPLGGLFPTLLWLCFWFTFKYQQLNQTKQGASHIGDFEHISISFYCHKFHPYKKLQLCKYKTFPLGLSFCEHGGDVESSEQNSTFTVLFPFRKAGSRMLVVC